MSTGDNPDYVPFLARFRAWWHGVEPGALVRAGGSEGDGANPSSAIVVDSAPAEADTRRYFPERVDVVQRLWGEECDRPGGAERTLSLVKPMALSMTKSACDLSTGLGGGTRLVHTELKVWIDAFEIEPELADLAQEFSRRHGLARKVPIRVFDLGAPDLHGKHFDGILMRECLFRAPNIRAVLDVVDAGLKSGGHAVITDFAFATDAEASSPAGKAWLAHDPTAGQPFTLKQYKQAMEVLGWDVRIFEDDSESYRHMVLAGWAGLIDGLTKADLTRRFVDAMLLEAEVWLARMKVLESGAVKLVRIHAIKP